MNATRHKTPCPMRRRALVSPRAAGLFGLIVLVGALFFAGPCRAGTLVTASCPCGYVQKGLPLFGGKANFKTSCSFPALCKATGEMTLINVLDPAKRPKNCPTGEIVSYEDPLMWRPDGGEPIVLWRIPGTDRVLPLFSGYYYCPRCHKLTLRFRVVGYWD